MRLRMFNAGIKINPYIFNSQRKLSVRITARDNVLKILRKIKRANGNRVFFTF